MTERIVDRDIRLISYYRNDAVSLPWYQDPQVCKQVDDRDTPYDLELLHAEKGMEQVTANIYSFNRQSQRMILVVGFEKTDEEWYAYRLRP